MEASGEHEVARGVAVRTFNVVSLDGTPEEVAAFLDAPLSIAVDTDNLELTREPVAATCRVNLGPRFKGRGGRSALAAAAYGESLGNMHMVRKEHPSDELNTPFGPGEQAWWVPIMRAIDGRKEATIQLHVNSGVNVNVTDTPPHYTVKRGIVGSFIGSQPPEPTQIPQTSTAKLLSLRRRSSTRKSIWCHCRFQHLTST